MYVYLDYNATTAPAPDVVEAVAAALRDLPGNASEWSDLSQSTVAILDQSTVAILDSSLQLLQGLVHA